MALEIQNHQQPLQQVHVSGGHDHGIAAGFRLASLHPATLTTLEFFLNNNPSSHIELEEPCPLPLGWQKYLHLKTGETYHTKNTQESRLETTKMSRRNGNTPKLDLKLNLSPPRDPQVESPSRSATVSPTSPQSSCVSSELNQDNTRQYSSSPEATSMVLVGCPRCLMYVMLAEDPRCPKCKSTVLLDVLHENNNKTTKKT